MSGIVDFTAAAFRPQPIARLIAIRIFAPLAILGFLASRIHHADDWLSIVGFRVPGSADWRQPVALPALPVGAAWTVAAAIVVAGVMTAAGVGTRWSSAVFGALLAYVALADRLSAFTVSKLAPVIALALCLSPSGARASLDAWSRTRRTPTAMCPTQVSGGCVRFFQVLLPVFYFASGLAKASGDWLTHRDVLWTQVHDSYQTTVSWWLANHVPPWMWTAMQIAVLVFECGAPLWFALSRTRPLALTFGVVMHLVIGLMFGPVIWFSLLMITLLTASYAPLRWLEFAFHLGSVGRRVHAD